MKSISCSLFPSAGHTQRAGRKEQGAKQGPSQWKGSRGFTKEHQSADLLLVEIMKLLIMRAGKTGVEILMCYVGRRWRMCWYSRGAVEHSLPWRVKPSLSLRSPSTLITADGVPSASHQPTRRNPAFIKFYYIRDNGELQEMARMLRFCFSVPHEGL